MTISKYFPYSNVRLGSSFKRRQHGFGFLAILFLVLSITFQDSARAGFYKAFDNYGRCNEQWLPPFGLTFDSSEVSRNGSTIRVLNRYKVLFQGQSYGGNVCVEWADYQIANEPQGPSVGSVVDSLYGAVRSWLYSRETKRTRPEYLIRTLATPCGVRGSLGSSLWGFSLTENSPDWAIGDMVLTQTEINAGEKVFVLVDSKGDEDWLELGVIGSANGTNAVFFKQALADFETNQWYEIEVPASLLVAGTNTYTYFLNSTGAPNSSVFFALGLFEDLAPTISRITSTNNAIGLQLSNLVSGFAYSVEQAATSLTTWQPTLTFTATNEVRTVTFPMTNSAMFYRVALPPP